MQEECNKCGAV